MYTSASVPLSQKLHELIIEKAMPVNEKDTEAAENLSPKAVADPEISRRGGRAPRRWAWTPEAVTFRKFCMSK